MNKLQKILCVLFLKLVSICFAIGFFYVLKTAIFDSKNPVEFVSRILFSVIVLYISCALWAVSD